MSDVATEPMYTDQQGRKFFVPVIDMAEDGTLRLPAEVLKALHVKGCETFTFEVDEEQGSITMYAVGDDDWLYNEETIARIREADEDSRAGRVREMSSEDLLKLLEESQ
jgi:antitoxin component of MazEF toxin-antitoxin module